MRSLALGLLLLSLVVAAGCSDSHGIEVDSGIWAPDAPLFPDAPWIGDASHTGMCSPDINPWNPMDPHNLCSPEGSTCTSGGTDQCGSFMSCRCETGHWSCAVAEADPVCWCGRQPSPGDRCNTEGMGCGECCPTPGGTGWPAMNCVAGHWQSSPCPDIVCPPLPPQECPANTHAVLGHACSMEGAQCGDACCGSAIVCESGTWHPGPEADCFACLSYACGDGSCPTNETCISRCGPTDGPEFVCAPRASSCNDCSCIPISPSERCEMIDGHPHVSQTGFCG